MAKVDMQEAIAIEILEHEYLTLVRTRKKILQKDLAGQLFCDLSVLSRYERGLTSPPSKFYYSWCKALEVAPMLTNKILAMVTLNEYVMISRVRLNRSIRSVAKEVGCDVSVLKGYEEGRQDINLALLKKLFNVLKITLLQFSPEFAGIERSGDRLEI